MSRSEPDASRAATPAGRRSRRLIRVPQTRSKAIIVVVWLALCAWAAIEVGSTPRSSSGDLHDLLPLAHQPIEQPLVMLSVEDSTKTSAATTTLLAAAMAVDDHLGDQRIPLAPPSAAAQAWLDAHSLYLLPIARYDELRDRLRDDAITSAIGELRARLSSPFFALAGDDVGRDPLGLAPLTASTHAALTGTGGRRGRARPTAAGDLLARDGTALLMGLRSLPDPQLVQQIRDLLSETNVQVALVGALAARRDAARLVDKHFERLVTLGFAAIALVLAATTRAVRPTLAIVACIASALMFCVALGVTPTDPTSLPLLVLLIGIGCEGPLGLQRISERGWPAAAVLASALLPLWLSPYPQWNEWSIRWPVAIAIVVGTPRILLPALLPQSRRSPKSRGLVLKPVRVLALAVAAIVLGLGAWANETLPYQPIHRLDLGDSLRSPEQTRMTRDFFDPTLVVHTQTRGHDRLDTLTRTADHTRRLQTLIPHTANAVEGPGRFVLQSAELAQRKQALIALDLPRRLTVVSEALASRGLRPDAFGEFLRSASDPEDLPTPQAALTGPLSEWIDAFMTQAPDGSVVMQTRVHLTDSPANPLPDLLDSAGQPIELRGPAAFARNDHQRSRQWLGIYIICQLWLGSFVVWLGTRSLTIAISAACSALISLTAVLSLMVPLSIPLGPAIIPVLLLICGVATVAAARACRAVELGRRFSAMGQLTTSLCQVAAGLSLATTDVPLWAQWGILFTIGAVIASGVGLFVAPGLAQLLRRTSMPARNSNPPPTEGGDA